MSWHVTHSYLLTRDALSMILYLVRTTVVVSHSLAFEEEICSEKIQAVRPTK